jgi:hypothetical protein
MLRDGSDLFYTYVRYNTLDFHGRDGIAIKRLAVAHKFETKYRIGLSPGKEGGLKKNKKKKTTTTGRPRA